MKIFAMEIIFYTIGCPKCNVLEKKLNSHKLQYTICRDVQKMHDLGFETAPMLSVDGKTYNYIEAVKFLNTLEV